METRVRADEEIRNHALARVPLVGALRTPETTSQIGSLARDRLETYAKDRQRLPARFVAREVRSELRTNHIAHEQRSRIVRGSQCLSRSIAELRVGTQDIEQDGRVNGYSHRRRGGPRISSSSSSTRRRSGMVP